MSTTEDSYFLKRFANPQQKETSGSAYEYWQRLWAKGDTLMPDHDISELKQWITRIQSYFKSQIQETQPPKEYIPADVWRAVRGEDTVDGTSDEDMEDGTLDTQDCNLKVSYG